MGKEGEVKLVFFWFFFDLLADSAGAFAFAFSLFTLTIIIQEVTSVTQKVSPSPPWNLMHCGGFMRW